MKIAIDARKWRDYGIGTYVRNLVRHLAHLDRETTYFLFCDRSDEATLRDLAENFVPVVDDSRGYSLREHISIPSKLRRLGVDLLHSPHYVLPLLCRRRAVVTIHDCIHLLFPEYLPNRMALTYAHRMMGHAIERSALVFTVSEASRRDILRFYPEADPERLQVVPNAIDAAILEHPGEEEMERVKERYQIRGRFVLYAGNIKPHKNLERLIARLRPAQAAARARRPEAADHRRRDQQVRRAAPARRGGGRAPRRALLRLRAPTPRCPRSTAWPPCSPSRPSTRASACPRWRRWPRGTPVVTSRISSLPEVVGDAAVLVDPYSVEDIASGLERVLGDDALRADLSWRPGTRASPSSAGTRSVRAIHGGYMKVLGVPPVPARSGGGARALKARARPRLADRACAAGRRCSSPWPACSRTRRSSRCCTSAGSLAPELEARDIRTTFVQHLPAVETHYRPYLPLFPAAAASIDLAGFDLVISSSHCVAKGVRAAPGARAPLLLPHARCATCGTATTTTSEPGRVSALTRGRRALGRGGACAPGTWPPPAACTDYAANSAYVAARIRRYYGRGVGRDPSARRHRLLHARRPVRAGDYDLVVSALVPYKRIELILDAYRGRAAPAEGRRRRPGDGTAARARRARRPSSSGPSTTRPCAISTAAAGRW